MRQKNSFPSVKYKVNHSLLQRDSTNTIVDQPSPPLKKGASTSGGGLDHIRPDNKNHDGATGWPMLQRRQFVDQVIQPT